MSELSRTLWETAVYGERGQSIEWLTLLDATLEVEYLIWWNEHEGNRLLLDWGAYGRVILVCGGGDKWKPGRAK